MAGVANRPDVARYERTRPQVRERVKFDTKEQGSRRRADPCALTRRVRRCNEETRCRQEKSRGREQDALLVATTILLLVRERQDVSWRAAALKTLMFQSCFSRPVALTTTIGYTCQLAISIASATHAPIGA